MHPGMRRQPGLHGRGGVRGGVVENDVQLLPPIAAGQPLEKGQEVGPRVPRAALPQDLATGNLEGRIQAGQAVAPVVVRLAGRQAWAQGQQGLRPAQRLDLRLLVHAHHHGVGRRLQVQADHIVDLGLGLRIGRELEGRHPMGLQGMRLPDPVHGAVRDPRRPGHIARRPVRHPAAGWPERQGHDLRALARAHRRRPARLRSVGQPRQAPGGEAPPNPAHLTTV